MRKFYHTYNDLSNDMNTIIKENGIDIITINHFDDDYKCYYSIKFKDIFKYYKYIETEKYIVFENAEYFIFDNELIINIKDLF